VLSHQAGSVGVAAQGEIQLRRLVAAKPPSEEKLGFTGTCRVVQIEKIQIKLCSVNK
jgi:hypothetical protein